MVRVKAPPTSRVAFCFFSRVSRRYRLTPTSDSVPSGTLIKKIHGHEKYATINRRPQNARQAPNKTAQRVHFPALLRRGDIRQNYVHQREIASGADSLYRAAGNEKSHIFCDTGR